MTELAEKPRDLKPFLALEAATLISGTGNGVAAIALPWLTLELTNDPAAAGLVVAVAALPQIAASLGSGVIIDRLGRQRTSVGSDVFSAVSAALIPLFGLLGVLTYPLVMFASVLGAIFDPVGVTAREAMLPDVAKRGRLSLERVNGLHEAVWGLAWLIGPGVAGVLIGLVGATASFWVMAAGFVLSALLVGAVCMPTPPARQTEAHWLAEALDGWRCMLENPAIRSTAVLSTIAFTIAYSVVGVVLPVVYKGLDQPEALGVLFMVYSGAGVLGALVYGTQGARISRRAVFLVGLVTTAMVPVAYAFAPGYPLQLAVMAVAGFFGAGVNPIVNVVLQERVPDEMRGRVLSALFTLAYVGFPFGYAAAGFSIKAMGETATFTWMGVATVLVVVWGAVTPALKHIEAIGVE
ncbi:MAG: MFS transporter [Coriobacteriia bacterium]|nr:MFS transporter [Coriobacteriia bacterium]